MKPPGVTPAQATVDFIAKKVGGGESFWRVTVVSAPWWRPVRRSVYEVVAFSDTIAAHEGLRRFEEEAATPKQPLVF